MAAEPERFVAAVRDAVRQGANGVERRLQVARENSWSARIDDMAALMESAIERRRQVADGYAGGVHVELSRHSHDAVETARKAIEFLRSI